MRRFILTMACCLATGATAGEVGELSLSSDYCAILRAFTQAFDPRCPPAPDNGQARNIPEARSKEGGMDGESGYFIQFSLDSAVLGEVYQGHLDRLTEVLSADSTKNLCLKVVGHADTSGAAGHNQELSIRRAKAVQLYLVAVRDLNSDRIHFTGKGESQPLPHVGGTDPLNRRVELLAKPAVDERCS